MADNTEVQAASVDHIVFHRSADTGRLHLETANAQIVREKESIVLRASASLMGLLALVKCDVPTIINQTMNVTMSEKGMNGKMTFAVSAIYKGDTRLVQIPVILKESVSELPDVAVVEALLNSATGMQKTAALALRAEVDAFIANRTVEVAPEPMKKAASAGPSASSSHLAQSMSVDKTWLPGDIEVGNLLFVGNAKYRVISGDLGKLNAEGSGSFWQLELVHEAVADWDKSITVL